MRRCGHLWAAGRTLHWLRTTRRASLESWPQTTPCWWSPLASSTSASETATSRRSEGSLTPKVTEWERRLVRKQTPRSSQLGYYLLNDRQTEPKYSLLLRSFILLVWKWGKCIKKYTLQGPYIKLFNAPLNKCFRYKSCSVWAVLFHLFMPSSAAVLSASLMWSPCFLFSGWSTIIQRSSDTRYLFTVLQVEMCC